ncbi:GspH/FimT family pseudopilin [Hahella sp. CR1]|uniref:GspH/FimT family pseudopilin n=1 Tax=Hahella sp. CR1 TaxID=2992807 RepID=UPI0024429377|nr:GspH/FimT family pseudopilin [Hahella sp. CR1]MDG9670389.1 GspH/FimT family pseudopilin [Hahella sp. CR1]
MKQKGFTLIELMLVVIITGMVLAFGVPSFQEMIRNHRLTSNTNEIVSALNFARVEAVKRGNNVRLGRRDGASWSGGLVVYISNNDTWDAGEELRLWDSIAGENTVTVSGSATSFVFSGTGEVDKSANVTIDICDDRTGEEGRRITILPSGVIVNEKLNCA